MGGWLEGFLGWVFVKMGGGGEVCGVGMVVGWEDNGVGWGGGGVVVEWVMVGLGGW